MQPYRRSVGREDIPVSPCIDGGQPDENNNGCDCILKRCHSRPVVLDGLIGREGIMRLSDGMNNAGGDVRLDYATLDRFVMV